ncbi:hypothetical protein TW65_01758 [Stemphylium lycopersici]|nr:hypothetical protein TW65_01758 [Stemphylium lycopersici]
MAEQAGRGKHSAKRHKPSRLRNEVRPDSTDDERDSQRRTVQQPDSDTTVTETQVDDIPRLNEHVDSGDEACGAGDPLMADDQATIDRLGIVKKAKATASKPDQIFELFSKKPSGLSAIPVSSLPAFSFAPPRQTLNKTPLKRDAADPHFASHATGVPLKDRENGKGSSSNAANTVAREVTSLSGIPFIIQDGQQHTDFRGQGETIHFSHLPTTSQHEEGPRRAGSLPNETASGLPPSAQPAPKSTKKARTTKKFRKSNKGSLSQQRGGVWPPRMPNTTGHVQNLNDVDQNGPEVFADPPDLSFTMASDDYPTVCAGENAVPHLSAQVLEERDPSYGATWEHSYAEHGAQPCPAMKGMLSTMSQGIPDAFAKRALPSSPRTLTIATMQHHIGDLGQQSLLVEENETVISRCEETPVDPQALTPPIQPHDDTLPYDNEVVDKEHASQAQSPQPCADANFEQFVTQSIGAEAVLHSTLNRGGSDRIAKPRRKPRANIRPISHGLHGSSTPSKVERSMENLRLAILADNFRVQHDHSVELKHQMEIATALREHVDLQKDSITGYKQQHQNLEGALGRLTEKAENNQRFVMGLQKDYEKLQNLSTAAQERSKKILDAKIAELEEEKENLRREFGMTTDRLVRSQKKIKAVVEDLYAQLVVNESEKKCLAERLTDQEAACTLERKKSEDLENKLFSGIQNLKSQFKNGSTILVNRLELIQASVERIAADDVHTLKIKECIEILQSLQAAPLLKVEDVCKLEGMIRFFRERMESGMEILSKEILTDGPSNADLQSSMQAQLNDLGTKLLKCEEIAAENRRIHENNATLIEQLEAHRQHDSQLKNHIENLKQVEIGLKMRCSQLERDLNDLRDASQRLPSETPDSERIILDLRQQLSTAKDDLEVANANSQSIKQSHRSLENEKTQLNEHATKLRDQEHEFQSKINRLELERSEKEKECSDLGENLNIANLKINELKKTVKDLQDSANQVQAELSLQRSATETIRQQEDDRINQMQKDTESTLLSSRNDLATAKRENQDLLSRLEQARANEDRMKAAETALVADQHRIQGEMIALRSTMTDRELEIVRIRGNAGEEKRKLVENHAAEIDDWTCRLDKTSTMLKEVEAQSRISKDQYHAKLTADRKVAESKLLDAEKQYHDALRKVQEQNVLSLQHSPQASSAELAVPESDQNNHYISARKKVDRPNQSTIEATLEHIHGLHPPSYIRPELSQTQMDDWDLFADAHQDQLGIENLQNGGHDYSIADHIPDFVSDTQNMGGLSMSQDFFTERLTQATPQQAGRRATSPTELSEMDSDELTRLQKEVQPVPASRLRGCNNNHSNPGGSRSTKMVVPVRSDGNSTDGSHSSHSQERPRSQANTASRMMPPPNSIPHQSQTRESDRIDRGKITAHHGYHMGISQKLRNSDTSTSDLINSEAAISKQIYSHYEPKASDHFGSRDTGHSYKRKMPSGQSDREPAPKRQCNLSPTRSIVSSSSILGQSPYTSRSSVIGTPSTENRLSHTKGVASTLSRGKSQAISSSIQSRTANSIKSSGGAHSARRQRMPRARETPQRRSSSRVTRSNSRNGTAFRNEFGERFNEELGGRY